MRKHVTVLITLLAAAATLVPLEAAHASGPQPVTFTGYGEYEYVVPNGVDRVRITANGEAGGTGASGGAFGGKGATVRAEFAATPGTTLWAEIGGFANTQNGGGGGRGGGASWVETCSVVISSCSTALGTSNDPRFIIAGGGGGGGAMSSQGTGGDAFSVFFDGCMAGSAGANSPDGTGGPGATCSGGTVGGGLGTGGGGNGGDGYRGGLPGTGHGSDGGGGGAGSSFIGSSGSDYFLDTNPNTAGSVTITPLTPPGAPTNVLAKAGNKSATVSWTAPADDGGYAIDDYTVVATPGGASVTVPAPGTNAVVSGLHNGVRYTFTVSARNAIGDGPNSIASNAVRPHRPRR